MGAQTKVLGWHSQASPQVQAFRGLQSVTANVSAQVVDVGVVMASAKQSTGPSGIAGAVASSENSLEPQFHRLVGVRTWPVPYTLPKAAPPRTRSNVRTPSAPYTLSKSAPPLTRSKSAPYTLPELLAASQGALHPPLTIYTNVQRMERAAPYIFSKSDPHTLPKSAACTWPKNPPIVFLKDASYIFPKQRQSCDCHRSEELHGAILTATI